VNKSHGKIHIRSPLNKGTISKQTEILVKVKKQILIKALGRGLMTIQELNIYVRATRYPRTNIKNISATCLTNSSKD